MLSIRRIRTAFAYSIGIISLIYIVWQEEFFKFRTDRFWDMSATLNLWPDCFDKWGIKTFSNNHDNIQNQGQCSRFNYGIFTMPLFKIMSFISQKEELWTTSLFIICIVLIVLCTPFTQSTHLIIWVILVSPPTTLLFESGNPDLLNIVLCLIAGIALHKRWVMLFVTTVSIVALHKYYGLIIWVIFLSKFFRKKNIRNILAWSVICASCLVICYQIFVIGLYQFSDAGNNHYGLTIWDNYFRKLDFYVNEKLIQLIGIISIISLANLSLRKKIGHFSESVHLSVATSTALVFYLVFIFSYTITSNVDYRLTFLGIALIMDSNYYLLRSLITRIAFGLGIISLFMSYPLGYREIFSGLPLQTLGDLLLHFVVIFISARTWEILKQLKLDLKEN